MTDPITYSLRLDSPNSDDYYRVIAIFADMWLERAWVRVEECIGGFQAYRRSMGLPERSFAEYAFEMLVLGVLLREYGDQVAELPGWKSWLLGELVRWQKRLPWAEGGFKQLRGRLAAVGTRAHRQRGSAHDVPRLLNWLRAQGRNAQAGRLDEWQTYLGSVQPQRAHQIVDQCMTLADSFAEESTAALGQYTEGVEHFLAETAPTYRGRYDAEMVSRPRLEYHLGMLGTEILNRAYRERFVAAKRKIVSVPPCMRARRDEECKAIQTPLGARCQSCTPNCRVHQVAQLGKQQGFDVLIIPEDLGAFGSSKGGTAVSEIGVVGVSCILTNWEGGWQTNDLGTPSQGVLLDYVGCSYHWHDEGIPTDTNLHKLREVLDSNSSLSEHSANIDWDIVQ
ncbi:MAG: DUF116 domain-containing protein [Anaerolineae bacterium]|nr:DUF116 domain-containing protein [Anaerolineae bacterium]